MREAERLNADIMVLVGGRMVFVNRHLEKRKFVYDLAKPTDFDGVVLLGTSLSSQEGHSAIAPLIIRFATLPMVSIGLDIGKGSPVLVDNADGMTRITEHLLDTHGYKRFAYISGPENNGEAKIRLKAFRSMLERRHLDFPSRHLLFGAFTEETGEQAICELIDHRKVDITTLDAIVAANDSMAVGAMDELVRRGYRVPSDIAIVGFDDIEAARYANAPLTTMQQPLIMLGERAVQRVLAPHDIRSDDAISVSPKLVIRRSCGCGSKVETPTLSTSPPANAGESLEQIVTKKRAKIENDLATIAERGGIPRGWEQQFMDQVVEACAGKGYRQVTDTVASLVKKSIETGEGIHVWAMILAALDKHLTHLVNAGTENSQRVEAILHRSRVAMSEATEYFHATKVRELRNHTYAFNQAAIDMLTTLETESLIEAAGIHLPKLGIDTCSIALFEDQNPSSYALNPLLVLLDGEKVENFEKFPASAIAAPVLTTDRNHALIVEPLCFYDDIFGVAALAYGPTDGSVYEQLGAFFSATIKALLKSAANVRATHKKDTTAHIDSLTGIYNDVHLRQRLAEEIPRAENMAAPLSLILLDMDDFQKLNDELGEAEGDRALTGIAETINRCVKPWEIVARLDEDSFAVLLPNADAEQAKNTAELIKRRLKLALAFEYHGHIAASFGIETVIPNRGSDESGVIDAAFRGLVTAKRSGKDQVIHIRDITG